MIDNKKYDFHKLKSEDIFNLINENTEIAVKAAVKNSVKEIKIFLECTDVCQVKAREVNWWMGFQIIRGKFYPLTYILIATAAFGGLILGLIILYKFGL
jgi:hypothetical protein